MVLLSLRCGGCQCFGSLPAVLELNFFGIAFLCVNIFAVYCHPASGYSHITSLIQVRSFFLVLFETFVSQAI